MDFSSPEEYYRPSQPQVNGPFVRSPTFPGMRGGSIDSLFADRLWPQAGLGVEGKGAEDAPDEEEA